MVMGGPVDIEPHEAILQCLRRMWGEVHFCDARIAELTTEAAVGPVETTISRNAYGGDAAVSYDQTNTGAPALNVWIRVRHEAYDRVVNYSKIALAAGVQERAVKAAERWAEGYANLLRQVLVDLGLDLNDTGTREVVVRHLTLLDGGQAAA